MSYEFDVIEGETSHFDELGRGRGANGHKGYDIEGIGVVDGCFLNS